MKQPRKLTLDQKKLLSKCGLNPADWMFRSETKEHWHFWNKLTKETKVINKLTLEVMDVNTNKKALTPGSK